MKYIDAERIKREIRKQADSYQDTFTDDLCKKLINFIDAAMPSIPPQNSIRKDVDLEEEVDKWYTNEASKEFEDVLYSDIEKFAKYFFELGLKAQKED